MSSHKSTLANGLVSRLALLGLCLVPIAGAAAAPAPADFVFRNGSIYTLDAASRVAAALAINGGYISSIGQDADMEPLIGADTRVVDLQGRMLMPGLIDSHMHVLTGGLDLLHCDMNYQPVDVSQLLAHIQGCIDGDGEKAGDDDWVEVVNLDYPSLVTKSGQVGKRELDTLQTKRPMAIRSSDYHTNLLNSRGLALSDITADTPDPPGGKIERLPGSQEPSGVLQDAAGRELVKIPPPTEAVRLEACRAALRLLRQAGITTFQEASAGPDHSTLFSQLRAGGELTARAYFDYSIEPPTSADDVEELVANTVAAIKFLHDNSTIGPKPTLKWQAVKGFLDGVITYPARTAAVVDPYWNPLNASDPESEWAPDPRTLNAPYWSPAILTATLEALFLAGVDAQLHVDGDLATRYGLDAAQAFLETHPGRRGQFRLGLAHEELSHPADWARFGELGVDPIMSFQWAQPSSFYIPSTFATLGDYRRGNLQAHRRIEEAGRPIVYGSDWPVG